MKDILIIGKQCFEGSKFKSIYLLISLFALIKAISSRDWQGSYGETNSGKIVPFLKATDGLKVLFNVFTLVSIITSATKFFSFKF